MAQEDQTTYLRPTVNAIHVYAQQRQLRHAAVGSRLRLLWHTDALLDDPCSADTGGPGSELVPLAALHYIPFPLLSCSIDATARLPITPSSALVRYLTEAPRVGNDRCDPPYCQNQSRSQHQQHTINVGIH
eukprot:scaffold22083_cov19-Prasinocladus_malaysianus.AAC.1